MSVRRRPRASSAGGDDSVTKFFAYEDTLSRSAEVLPIVTRETARVDSRARYNAVAGKAASYGS